MDPKTAITFKNMKSFESFGNLIKGFNTHTSLTSAFGLQLQQPLHARERLQADVVEWVATAREDFRQQQRHRCRLLRLRNEKGKKAVSARSHVKLKEMPKSFLKYADFPLRYCCHRRQREAETGTKGKEIKKIY